LSISIFCSGAGLGMDVVVGIVAGRIDEIGFVDKGGGIDEVFFYC
jgi:hypothetical protein